MNTQGLLPFESPLVKGWFFPVGKKISRGAKYLDDVVGENWRERIDCRTLDMASPVNDILGQLFGDYLRGCQELRINPLSHEPIYHGFTAEGYRSLLGLRELQALRRGWIVAIKHPALANLNRMRIAA